MNGRFRWARCLPYLPIMAAIWSLRFRQHFEASEETESEDSVNADGGDIDDEEYEAPTEAEIEDFESREFDHEVEFGPIFKRLSCFSHTLQLVVRPFDEVKSSKKVLKAAHKVVKK